MECIAAYEEVCDWLLFDTKTQGQSGGSGQIFDWTLLKDKTFKCPWMLSGGLNSENIQDALSLLRPDAVDVSSGVEVSRGIKSPVRNNGIYKCRKISRLTIKLKVDKL